ncbi:MAG: hypothetical protein JXA30_10630 [Deltaproteobacteria bacterium]|nr:hypothetical protein [Deltaproteobacteria bacterium]
MIRLIFSILCAVLLYASIGFAQEQPNSATAELATAADKSDQSELSERRMDDLIKRVETAEKENARLKDNFAKLSSENAELKGRLDQLSERMDEAEEADAAALQNVDNDEFKQQMDIYGFLDVDFFYYDFKENDKASLTIPTKPSFTENHLNLYFSGQMERTLSVLAEVRFSYLPNGSEKTVNIPALGTEYSRVSTRTIDYYDWQEVITHSVVIERAVFTWKPYDFFAVAAGRFITPFGIWVIDHSPTVSIPARLPHLITINSLPLAQTGVELFGRVFPLSHTHIDYAVTLSNGRGPAEALFDLDDNKAIGLRLKGTYEIDDFSASLGGYLYWGTYTDVSKSVLVGSRSSEPDFVVTTTERYEELSTALDLTVEIYRIRLQGEYCRQPRIYSIRPMLRIRDFDLADPLGGYAPDSISWFSYALLAYSIPLKIAGLETELIPFTLYEYNKVDYYYPKNKIQGFRFGLNFKPSPFVAIKYESASERLEAAAISGLIPNLTSKYWVHSAQAAVSF